MSIKKFLYKRNGDAITKILKYTVVGLAFMYLLFYVFIAFSRITYNFELEWMEGGSLAHVQRIIDGKDLYAEPSSTFIPFIYTPLYFFVSAFVSKILGLSFFSLRLVSFVSSLGCIILIFLFVRRETRCWLCSFVASGFFAAAYKYAGAWLDIARTDSLFLLLLLSGIYVLKAKNSIQSLVVSAILFFLSFFSKQTALFIAVPSGISCFFRLDKRKSCIFLTVFLFLVGFSTLLYTLKSSGWYYYYVFEAPGQHNLLKEQLINFWIKDILQPMSLALLCSLFFVYHLFYKRKFGDFALYILLFIGMFGASWYSRLHSGGYNNVLLPAYAFMAVCFGLGINVPLSFLSRTPQNEISISGNKDNISHVNKRSIESILYIVCIVQFVMLTYNPFTLIPSRSDAEAGEKLVNMIRSIEGDVFIPSHPYLSVMAGKKSYVHEMALLDIFRTEREEAKKKVWDEIQEKLRNKQFEAIILYQDSFLFMKEVVKNYEYKASVFNDDSVFWPVTGKRLRPEFILFRKKE